MIGDVFEWESESILDEVLKWDFNEKLEHSLGKLLRGELLDEEEYQILNCAGKCDKLYAFDRAHYWKNSVGEKGDEIVSTLTNIFFNNMVITGFMQCVNLEELEEPDYEILESAVNKLILPDTLTTAEKVALGKATKTNFLKAFRQAYSAYLKGEERDNFCFNMCALSILALGNTPTIEGIQIEPISKEQFVKLMQEQKSI